MNDSLDQKLGLLAEAAQYDLCATYAPQGRRYRPRAANWATPELERPDGRPRPLFRLLMSSACAWNCAYCPLRAGRDQPRASLSPEELAATFLPRFEANAVQGLFLSTAVDGSPDQAVGRMLDGVELLRTRHNYRGYIHVKLLPGVVATEVERAARLADRLSLNLEAPSAAHLARLAPERRWREDLLERLVWAREWSRAGLVPAGLATQFVVGPAGEHDQALLRASSWLYRELGLRRVYFGAFAPVADTPLADAERTPLMRVQRLFQADWLLRQYGFGDHELPFDQAGDLPLHLDPKLAWALAHPERFPVELNRATPEELLRVPGIGPLSVQRILRLRRINPFRELSHLASLGSQALRARDFVTLEGRFLGRSLAELARIYAPQPQMEQLPLW